MNLIQRLQEKGLITPPSWLPTNIHYLTMMGSMAYAVSDATSDVDVYGFCIPQKEIIFPHLGGEIFGFGTHLKRFDQFQHHHIKDEEANKQYDLTVYSIVKFFQLCMENNPNMVDALYTPSNCVLFTTQIGERVRDHRDIFLHRGCWHKFKGYAFSQLHKMSGRDGVKGARKESIEKWGYDIKFAYHVVRLLDEVEQILTTGTLDLTRAHEILKSIRRGEWTEVQVRQYFSDKERQLEEAYSKSELPWGPREAEIRKLLVECLEIHFGELSTVVIDPGKYKTALDQIKGIVDKI